MPYSNGGIGSGIIKTREDVSETFTPFQKGRGGSAAQWNHPSRWKTFHFVVPIEFNSTRFSTSFDIRRGERNIIFDTFDNITFSML